MAVPLDAIREIHNAFRKDLAAIDSAAFNAAQGLGNLDLVLKRYQADTYGHWRRLGRADPSGPISQVADVVSFAYFRLIEKAKGIKHL